MQSTLGEVEHETFFASNGNSEKKIRAPDGEDQKSASFINDLPLWETRDGVEKSCLFSQATLPCSLSPTTFPFTLCMEQLLSPGVGGIKITEVIVKPSSQHTHLF